jgi:capsular exopolysaccharide synthesis family protein
MGDVFDAMNRSKKERGDQPAPPPSGAAPADDSAPALPKVDARSLASEEPAPVRFTAPAVVHRTVSDAMTKTRGGTAVEAGKSTNDQLTPPTAFHRDPSLNAYAAEVIVHHDRGSVITEQYRAIRTQILARARNRRLQTHVVTSATPEEGKSVTTINLGMAFSELRNQKTLIIEADLRRPSFGRLFNRTSSPGLIHLLRGEVDELDKAMHPTVYDNLFYIPAGDRDQTASTELLSSPRMAQVLDRLKDRFEHIFIDTPPVVTVTDAAILGAICDETLLVVRLHRTPAEVVDRAKRLLRAANCDLAGVILTHAQQLANQYAYRYA